MLNGFPDNFRRSDEDVLNEFRQKQVNFDLEERRNEISNSRSLFIGALAGLLMAGVVGWVVLAPQYASDNPEDIPIIRRQQTEVKMPPAEPGGIEFSSRENTVYEIIERKNEQPEEEIVLPPAETPDVDAIETLISESESVAETAAAIKVESLTGGAPKVEKVAESITAKNAEKPVVNKIAEKAPEKAAAAKLAEKTAAAVAVKETKPTVIGGDWRIQLMSSPNKAAVEKSWQNLVKKYPLLKDQPHEISAADLGKKGVFYRLRAGSFASKDAATAFCSKLKAAGGSCFTAKK